MFHPLLYIKYCQSKSRHCRVASVSCCVCTGTFCCHCCTSLSLCLVHFCIVVCVQHAATGYLWSLYPSIYTGTFLFTFFPKDVKAENTDENITHTGCIQKLRLWASVTLWCHNKSDHIYTVYPCPPPTLHVLFDSQRLSQSEEMVRLSLLIGSLVWGCLVSVLVCSQTDKIQNLFLW